MGIETKVYYDETGPTCPRFAVKCGRGRNVRRPGDVAGWLVCTATGTLWLDDCWRTELCGSYTTGIGLIP
jgi:hypothetical protein